MAEGMLLVFRGDINFKGSVLMLEFRAVILMLLGHLLELDLLYTVCVLLGAHLSLLKSFNRYLSGFL